MEGVIDFSKSKSEFITDLDKLLLQAVKLRAVIPLPVHEARGVDASGIMSLILSSIDCSSCNAKCCHENHGTPIPVMEFEKNLILSKYGISLPDIGGHWWGIRTPCPLLSGDKCICYSERPMVCRFYPLQPGMANDGYGVMYSLDSICPQAPILARKIYIITYELRENQEHLMLQTRRMS